jgi:hypothetical protein
LLNALLRKIELTHNTESNNSDEEESGEAE